VTEVDVKDTKVSSWLTKFAESTQDNYGYHFDRWMKWMEKNGGALAGLSPSELLEYQREASNSESYVILDLVQRHCRETPGRYHYKLKPYTAVRSFFKHSRAPLPADEFSPRAELPPVMGDLPLEEVKLVILSSNPVYRAVYLCILQGGIDEAGICDWSKAGVEDLKRDLSELAHVRRSDRILRIDLPGRKKFRNIRPFYTYVGSDAVDALVDWMKRRPEDAEAIFTNQYGKPISGSSMRNYWTRKMKRLGIIEPGEPGNKGNRYGKNLHELRDVFRSQWEKSPAKGSVAEFMMGHQIDPLEYNKACRDKAWTFGEYRKALPMFEILSSGRPFGRVEEDEVEVLRTLADEQARELLILREKVVISQGWEERLERLEKHLRGVDELRARAVGGK